MLDLLKEAFNVKTDGLFLVVMGASGAGKSHFIGTYPGRVLLLYGAGESHGPGSAAKSNANIVAIPWDRIKKDGSTIDLPPSQILSRIRSLLDPEALVAAGVKCVAVDSLTNLVADLKKTDAFMQRCLASNGKHNAFKETEALIELTGTVIRQLQVLSDYHGIDSICTLDLQIQNIGADGTIIESKPGLPTFGVGKALIQQFPDVLVLGRLGEDKQPTFQNLASVASTTSDQATKELVRYVEYNPRLRGAQVMPATIAASVPAIMALKGEPK